MGSHILDRLRLRGIPTAALLRPESDRRFVSGHLPDLEIRSGSIAEVDSLKSALKDITHVIHCAGCTKARRNSEFYAVNQVGTRNVVAAVNYFPGKVIRLLHVSSLAAIGPATAARPAREEDSPNPVSEYGRSKLAAETELQKCRASWTIIRPPAVYGPRDTGFRPLFKAIKRHLRPQTSASQALSLVFAPDLAEVIVTCLDHPRTSGKAYFACNREIVTGRLMAEEVARQMKRWTVPLPLPPKLLWPVCVVQQLCSRVTAKPMLLNLQKYAELRAPGWVCDATRLKNDTGCECPTGLKQGVSETVAWYKTNGWI